MLLNVKKRIRKLVKGTHVIIGVEIYKIRNKDLPEFDLDIEIVDGLVEFVIDINELSFIYCATFEELCLGEVTICNSNDDENRDYYATSRKKEDRIRQISKRADIDYNDYLWEFQSYRKINVYSKDTFAIAYSINIKD